MNRKKFLKNIGFENVFMKKKELDFIKTFIEIVY